MSLSTAIPTTFKKISTEGWMIIGFSILAIVLWAWIIFSFQNAEASVGWFFSTFVGSIFFIIIYIYVGFVAQNVEVIFGGIIGSIICGADTP